MILKSKVDSINIDQLKIVSADLNELSYAVGKKSKTCMIN